MSSPSAWKYFSPGRARNPASIQPFGVLVEMPMPLSSQTNSSGSGTD